MGHSRVNANDQEHISENRKDKHQSRLSCVQLCNGVTNISCLNMFPLNVELRAQSHEHALSSGVQPPTLWGLRIRRKQYACKTWHVWSLMLMATQTFCELCFSHMNFDMVLLWCGHVSSLHILIELFKICIYIIDIYLNYY